MNLIDQINEINPNIESHLAQMLEPDNDYELMGYLTEWLEKKGYCISMAAIHHNEWKADIMLPDESIKSYSNEFKTSYEARLKMLLKAVEIFSKNTEKHRKTIK